MSSLLHLLNIPLYDDVRVSYDLLRFPTALITKRSAREILSPYTLFARNHITSQDECVVRMSQLHLNPWLSVYANPDNSIVLDENFPLLPADLIDQWDTPKIDNTIVNMSRTPGSYIPMPVERKHLVLIDEVKPIDASKISVPNDNLAILNFNESPDQLRLNQAEQKQVDNFCMRNVKLSVQLNTADNFRDDGRQGQIDDTSELLRRLEGGKPVVSSSSSSSRPSERDDFLSLLRY